MLDYEFLFVLLCITLIRQIELRERTILLLVDAVPVPTAETTAESFDVGPEW